MLTTALPLSSARSHRPLWAIGAITSIEFIDNGMTMFAATQISVGLGLSARQFGEMCALYGAAAIVLLYVHHRLVEHFGYRQLIFASLALNALGALCCALAESSSTFACGRLLQGAGGATFFTAGRMAINSLPGEQRTAGVLTFVGSLLAGTALAPLLAASLLTVADWRAIFWLALPQAALAGWIAAPLLALAPPPPKQAQPWLWRQLAWLGLAALGFLHGVASLGESQGQEPLALPLSLVSLLALAAFARAEWRHPQPLLNLRALRQSRYLLGLLLYFFAYFLIGASAFMLPLLFQHVLARSLLNSALLISGSLAGSVLMALTHIRISRHWPRHRLFMLSGLSLHAGASLWLACSGLNSIGAVFVATLLSSMAIPLIVGPVAFGTFVQLEAQVFSHGYQLKNIIRQLGLASSVALCGLAWHAWSASPSPAAGLLTALAEWARFLGNAWPPGEHPAARPEVLACRLIFATQAACSLPLLALIWRQRTFR